MNVSKMYSENGAVGLRIPLGAKAISLGGAYAASVRDSSAILWNPAGLAYINGEIEFISPSSKEKEIIKEFQELDQKDDLSSAQRNINEEKLFRRTFEMQVYSTVSLLSLDRNLLFVGVGFTSLGGTIGVGFRGDWDRGFQGYDENGLFTESFSNNTGAAFLTYAFEEGHFRIGFNLMGLREDLDSDYIYGGGIDGGLQFITSVFEIGANIQNIVGVIQESASKTSDFTRLDIILRMSAAINIPRSPIKFYIGTTANLDDTREGFRFNGGVAIDLFKYTSLSIGLDHTNPALGLFFDFPYISIGYSVNRDILAIGFQHHVELNISF